MASRMRWCLRFTRRRYHIVISESSSHCKGRGKQANGFELSGPAKSPSYSRTELAGSACPGVVPGLQRDWNEKAGSSETCFIVYDEHTSQRTQGCKRRNRPWLRIACLLSDWTSVTGALTSPFSTRMVN